MNDDALSRRLLDAVLAPPDPERDRALEAELSDHPELLREYRELRGAWKTFGHLPVGEPPEGARERAERAVRTAAREAGRTAPAGPRRKWGRRAFAAAALLVAFLGGAGVGAWWTSPRETPLPTSEAPAEVADGPRYVLLIRGGGDAEDPEALTEAMVGWARELWSQDRLLWAERLTADASVRVGGGAAPAPVEPRVGGLFVIRASDREEAARLAGKAPHLAHGGVVDVLPTGVAPER